MANKKTSRKTKPRPPALSVAPCSARAHSRAKIRKGLYNYRAYNILRFPKGWAVRDEDGKPWHSPMDTLGGVCRMIDRIEDHNTSPNNGSDQRART